MSQLDPDTARTASAPSTTRSRATRASSSRGVEARGVLVALSSHSSLSSAQLTPRRTSFVDKQERQLVQTLDGDFPGDVGVFCTFVLNIVRLKPGEAVFLKANEPHAYLDGDIMERMATSDNVVRAGLTPKLRDVPTLTSTLT
ncbi:hypothetical protein JCM8208_004634 [Rhodotorula glutinis]